MALGILSPELHVGVVDALAGVAAVDRVLAAFSKEEISSTGLATVINWVQNTNNLLLDLKSLPS